MRKLLNTLYVMTPETYLALENDNIIILLDEKVLGKFPLHTLEQIVYFGYKGASPALMGECAKRNIGLYFYRPNGRFLARTVGTTQGNVLLRKEQYRCSDDEIRRCQIAKYFIVGKIFNSRSVLERAKRDHPMSFDIQSLKEISSSLLRLAKEARKCCDLDSLRGYEGEAASLYFSVFDHLILQNKKIFSFKQRMKRPPKDSVNALLSFCYTILANDCASALEAVGLDAYVGFLHRDRPGRISLALDLMEELRSIYADRFVLTLINNRKINASSFERQENGAVLLNDKGRKIFLTDWQNRKKDIIKHPFLDEKIPWGLVPFVQAQLLGKVLRGDLDVYPSFLWK